MKKTLSLLLSLVMALTLWPAAALASAPWGSMNSAPNSSSPLIPFFSILFIGKPPCNYEIVLRKAGSAPFHYRVQTALAFS